VRPKKESFKDQKEKNETMNCQLIKHRFGWRGVRRRKERFAPNFTLF